MAELSVASEVPKEDRIRKFESVFVPRVAQGDYEWVAKNINLMKTYLDLGRDIVLPESTNIVNRVRALGVEYKDYMDAKKKDPSFYLEPQDWLNTVRSIFEIYNA